MPQSQNTAINYMNNYCIRYYCQLSELVAVCGCA